MKDNPILQILLAVVIFLLGGAFGGMWVRLQQLEGKSVLGVAQAGQQQAQQAGGAPEAAPTIAAAVKVKVTADDPVKGDPKAKVTVVEFADYQCPFCARFHSDVYLPIVKEYVDTGKVKFVFKNLAFLGQESTDAANAALCAKEQNKFWEFHDHLFTNHNGENQGAFSNENLKGFAATLGLATEQFNGCLDSAKYQKQVDADQAEANKNGFNSTPSTVVGTTPVVGAQSYASFKSLIDAELAKK